MGGLYGDWCVGRRKGQGERQVYVKMGKGKRGGEKAEAEEEEEDRRNDEEM
jgi:hypothetical protein